MRVRKEESKSPTQRLEAFSDGVFAIAITLLILEIKIPHLADAAHTPRLKGALLALWPSYFAYVFSFVMVGIYWANHHYIFRLYKDTNHLFNLLNVLFLMCISFLPFPTAVLGEYILDPHERHTAVIFYAFGLLLPALSWSFVWRYASHNYRLIDPKLEPRFVAALTRQYDVSTALYLLSLAAAVFNANFGLVLSVGHTFLYLLPPKPPIYRESESGQA